MLYSKAIFIVFPSVSRLDPDIGAPTANAGARSIGQGIAE
jgi:hypothetical protein